MARERLTARFLVDREALVGNNVLLQATTGARGEILALTSDRDWHVSDLTKPPYRYTVTSWRKGTLHVLQLDDVTLRLTHVQTFGRDEFLLVASRAGGRWDSQNAMIVTTDGIVQRRLTLSDGIEDVQVDAADRIWVSYFDEGVFSGLEFSAEGLVCFAPNLDPILRFNTLARSRGLPQMYDCYALNVASTRDTYAYFWGASDVSYFPFVRLRNGDVAHHWQITTVKGAHAVAIDRVQALFGGGYQHPGRLTLMDLATGKSEEVVATDSDGQPITEANEPDGVSTTPLIWGRGNRLYLLDHRGVWELTVPKDR